VLFLRSIDRDLATVFQDILMSQIRFDIYQVISILGTWLRERAHEGVQPIRAAPEYG